MAKRRTKEEIELARLAKAEKKARKLRTDWMNWGSTRYAMYTACTQCSNMANCRGKHREIVVCEICHFGTETNDGSGVLRRVPVTV